MPLPARRRFCSLTTLAAAVRLRLWASREPALRPRGGGPLRHHSERKLSMPTMMSRLQKTLRSGALIAAAVLAHASVAGGQVARIEITRSNR